MNLSELVLDKYFCHSLEILAIRNGLIKNYLPDFGDGSIRPIREPHSSSSLRVARKTELLRNLTLFETVESEFSQYDMSELVDAGLVGSKSTLAQGGRINPKSFEVLRDEHPTEAELAKCIALKNFRSRKKWLQKRYIKEYPSETGRYGRWRLEAIESDINIFLSGDWPNPFDAEGCDKAVELFASTFSSLQMALFTSITYQKSILTQHSLSASRNALEMNHADIVSDLYYLVKTRLTDEITILPSPRNLDEVLEFRQRDEMRSFRNILAQWLEVVCQGDVRVEARIRADLKKANRAMKIRTRVEKYSSSPINFWVGAIGGHIPVLSNVLAVANTAEKSFSWWAEKKHGWAMLCK